MSKLRRQIPTKSVVGKFDRAHVLT